MKYWFFNGEDIIGPLAVQEMALQPGFVSTSLICPEHASEDAESWKPAFCFAEFHFDEVTGKLALVSAPEPAPVRPVRVRKRSQKPAKPVAAEMIRLSKPKEKKPISAPIVLAKGQPVDLILPTPAGEVSNPAADEKKPQTVVESPVEQTVPEKIEEMYFSSCVLPVVPEKMNDEKLPFLPEGEVPFIPPAEPEFSFEDDMLYSISQNPLPKDETQSAATSPQEKAEDMTVTPAPASENAPATPEESVESTVSQVKARLVPTPEIEEFLTDQRLAILPERKRPAKWVLAFLIVLLVPGVIGLLMQAGCFSSKKIVETAPAVLPVLEEEDVADELTQIPMDVPAAELDPVEEEAEPGAEKALTAVQNYTLPAEKGTIASYFAKLYKERLEQGYTASWSAEPLHNSTYIVKYRIAKTRAEPVVYVFQADVAKNQLTGALNNAALDLVGKI